MAEELVTNDRLEAGREYLAKLKDLGFEPEAAFWSIRVEEPETLELSLFSAVVERLGPRRVFEALFEAYEHARTPQTFDPWQVALYSPEQLFYDAVFKGNIFDDKGGRRKVLGQELEMGGFTEKLRDGVVVGVVQDYVIKRYIHRNWVYTLPPVSKPKRDVVQTQLRRFEQFEREARLAA